MTQFLGRLFIMLSMVFLFSSKGYGQILYRVEANFSIKEKSTSGYENLMLGKVYFDRTEDQIVFDVRFPEKEIIVINDTASINCIAGTYQRHNLGTSLVDFSVLSLFVHGNLDYFGLEQTPFQLSDVEEDDGLVISTWKLNEEQRRGSVSKMLLSQKDNNLHGLITFDPNDKIISKQIFSDYVQSQNLPFPSKVLQISYLSDGSQLTKLTQYSNVLVNAPGNEAYYNYKYKPVD